MILVRKITTFFLLFSFGFQGVFAVEYGVPLSELESLKEEYEVTEGVQEVPKTLTVEKEIPEDMMKLIAAQKEYQEEKKPSIQMPLVLKSGEQSLSPAVLSPSSPEQVFSDFFGTQAGSPIAPSFPKEKIKQYRVATESRFQKNETVEFKKHSLQVDIASDTLIQSANGNLIDPSSIGVFPTDNTIKTKAAAYHEKHQKQRSRTKKSVLESAFTFDFGTPGVHLLFSKPVKIEIQTPNFSDGVIVDIATLHAGDTTFHTGGLTLDGASSCTNGETNNPASRVVVKNGKVVFYTCGASSFTMNPSGGTTGSNDLRLIVGDCAQVQIYYNNLTQIYTGSPPASGCSTSSTMDAWPVLRIGTTNYGNDFTAWTTSTTTGSTIANTYTATSTMTAVVGGLTYQLIIDWSHTAPNKYFTWSWRVVVPTGNTLPIKFYYGMDSMVAGSDTDDIGYFSNTGGTTVGIYDSVANVLSAFRSISGTPWSAYEADAYGTVRDNIVSGSDFNNTIQPTGGDLGFGVNWDFGTPTTAVTYSGVVEWKVTPFNPISIADPIPGIGQPEGPLTVGFLSQMPIVVSNVGSLSSSGLHSIVLTLPTNISGPTSPFVDGGWSCGAQITTTVTCIKTTTIAPSGEETFRIPVTPLPASVGTNVTFNIAVSNSGDGNTANNTAFATNAVVGAAPTVAPGGVTGPRFWAKAGGGKNCTTTGCTITTWFNSGVVAINATTGLGTVTYDPATPINYNPTLYFNNASLNINNNLALPTRANSIFVVSRIGAGGNFYIGTQTATTGTRSWRTSPTTDQWMRYNSTVFYNGANNRAANVPAITSTIRQTAGASAGYTNGRSLLTSTSTLTFSVNNLGIGRNATTNSTLSNVAEVIIYNTALTTTQQNQVESYLALKYGITLDQIAPKNYLFANGSTVAWNAALAGVYNRDIAGVARDDTTGLNQLKSQSINNPGDIITETVGSIGSNARALVWGNNAAATGTLTTTDTPPGYQRIDREWQFQEKNGDVGMVKISYPASSLPLGTGSGVYMLVDMNGVFTAGATAYTGTLVGSNWEWNLNITDMSVITFAKKGDTTAPTLTSSSIASGTLIPHGNFTLTFGYTDTGSSINVSSFTGKIYAWDSIGNTWQTTDIASTYMDTISATSSTGVLQISGLPFGKYRFDITFSDTAGNSTLQSFTYFVDKVEWTISSDTYNIGDVVSGAQTFGTGELIVTVKTVGAGFALTLSPNSTLVASTDTISYWNGTLGWGYDFWNGTTYSGNISSHATSLILANTTKNINTSGQQNTFTYRLKYGAKTQAMQSAGNYIGTVNFGLSLNY